MESFLATEIKQILGITENIFLSSSDSRVNSQNDWTAYWEAETAYSYDPKASFSFFLKKSLRQNLKKECILVSRNHMLGSLIKNYDCSSIIALIYSIKKNK